MNCTLFIRHIFNSKLTISIFSVLLTLLAIQASSLEASEKNTTAEAHEYEGANWDEVDYNSDSLHFTALIPNYSGISHEDNTLIIQGGVSEDEAEDEISQYGISVMEDCPEVNSLKE